MDPDFFDDWFLLRGREPKEQPAPDLIAHLVYLSEGREVSPRLPIYQRVGEGDVFNIEWQPEQRVTVDRVQVLMGTTVIWEQDLGRTLMFGDTLKMNLVLKGARELFDRTRDQP